MFKRRRKCIKAKSSRMNHTQLTSKPRSRFPPTRPPVRVFASLGIGRKTKKLFNRVHGKSTGFNNTGSKTHYTFFPITVLLRMSCQDRDVRWVGGSSYVAQDEFVLTQQNLVPCVSEWSDLSTSRVVSRPELRTEHFVLERSHLLIISCLLVS